MKTQKAVDLAAAPGQVIYEPDRKATKIIVELIKSFPCLRKKLGSNWAPYEFEPHLFRNMMDCWSHGEWMCGMFVLNVWNPGYAKAQNWSFDIFEFLGTADPGNRKALLDWCGNPIWP